MSTLTICIPETKHARLRALAAKGSVKRGLELLDKLDRRFRRRKTTGG